MAAPVGGTEVARRVIDDLINFSGQNFLNALIAEMEAFEDPREVFDTLMRLRNGKNVENSKLIGLNELITQAEEEIEMKKAQLEAMDDVTWKSGVDYAAWYVHFEELDAYVTTGSLAKRHLKTLSLNELRSSSFNLFFDQEYSEEEEEIEEPMAETKEQYMSKSRADYGSGVARPKIKEKYSFELKGQFLKELRSNTLSGSDHEDVKEHIEKVLKIVDLFHIPNITIDQVMLRAFPMSLTGAASR
ncbi:hypothetical protein Tco_0881238 [Tanacetum coccineum]